VISSFTTGDLFWHKQEHDIGGLILNGMRRPAPFATSTSRELMDRLVDVKTNQKLDCDELV